MATGELPRTPADAEWSRADASAFDLSSMVTAALEALASLRLTVVLFALSIFLVFVGTLAQVDHDVWHVVNHTYFRVWVAQVEWRAFGRLLAMFKDVDPVAWTATFPFPGGRTIGLALAANLLAAHAIRFKTSAKGRRLAVGLGVIAAGAAATAAVIVSGMDNAVESELSPEFCNYLWQTLRAAYAGLALLGCWWLASKWGTLGRVEWSIAGLLVAVVVGSAIYLLVNGEWRINDSGLRILWQLLKCMAAAALLLVGCVMAFKKRAGIVLLHGGVGLLLASELMTDLTANEAKMMIDEGQTTNVTADHRTTELAVIDPSSPDTDRVTVIPQSLLESAARSGEPIEHADLPFDVRVVSFYQNSELRPAVGGDENLADSGLGERLTAVELKSVNGVTNTGANYPSAYVELLDKESSDSLGTYCLSTHADVDAEPTRKWFIASLVGLDLRTLNMQTTDPTTLRAQVRELSRQSVDAAGGTYDIALRFKRSYKPYSVKLIDFSKDVYVGTNTPKNFSSDVRLTDPERQIDRDFRTYMNNPLRYGGDTLYQSSYDGATERTTVLQVVTNRGWMLPYVSLMIVGTGMLYQFLVSLGRFVNRRSEADARAAKRAEQQGAGTPREAFSWTDAKVWFPLLIAIGVGGYLLSKARPPQDARSEMHVHAFGALPLAEGGRVKPYDTLARTQLQFLSGRQEVKLDDGTKVPAITWFLDTITGANGARDYKVFRIENLDLIDTLGLEPRPGKFRYSYNELLSKRNEIGKQLDLARNIPDEQRTVFQKKVGELGNRFINYNVMVEAFGSPKMGGDPSQINAQIGAVQAKVGQLRRSSSARSTPPPEAGGEWLTLYEAEFRDLFARAAGRPRNPATAKLVDALTAYAEGDRREFNEKVRQLADLMADLQAEQNDPASADKIAGMALAERINLGAVQFETFFTAFSPFYYCAACYVIAFVLAVASWVGWSRPLSRAATVTVVITLLVHTFAVFGRIYISGRPPVTNLYSSAIFIGWGGVLFGVLIEALFRRSIGNVLAAVVGFPTLVVAHQLSLDGDTFTVMQAVLDTQFWLATHVVCITLGYVTTFVAGAAGAMYLLYRLVAGTPVNAEHRKSNEAVLGTLSRITYGVICFAMLFSFVGTVLGGLWADDSWGRFWGWDPKENGALIIVLWNALILHANWGKLIRGRGLATLAVLGNIVTTWSWFGVNELGVGLHAYGASERNTSLWLLAFAVSQALIALLAAIPTASSAPRREPAA